MPPTSKKPFENYAGALPAFSSKDEINEWVRSLRDEEIDSVPSAAERTDAEALGLS